MHHGSATSPDSGILLNGALLRRGAAVARSLDAGRFTAPSLLSPGGSVGKHLRHVAEFYEAFLDGAASGHVDYEERRRDGTVENSPVEASRRLEELARRLEAIDPSTSGRLLRVRGEGSVVAEHSTVGRELDVLLSHTIHHYALVAVFLRALGIEPPDDFGVAPSTLRHWEAATAP